VTTPSGSILSMRSLYPSSDWSSIFYSSKSPSASASTPSSADELCIGREGRMGLGGWVWVLVSLLITGVSLISTLWLSKGEGRPSMCMSSSSLPFEFNVIAIFPLSITGIGSCS